MFIHMNLPFMYYVDDRRRGVVEPLAMHGELEDRRAVHRPHGGVSTRVVGEEPAGRYDSARRGETRWDDLMWDKMG